MSKDNVAIQCLEHPEKELNLYCLECKVLVCSKCLNSKHKGHAFDDIDDQYKSLLLKSKDLLNEMRLETESILQEKEIEINKFNGEIKDTYHKQKDEISNYFRELHDSLHIKEVELKRELESYHNENEEIFSKLISKYDYKNEQLNNSIKQLENENNTSSTKLSINSSDKIKFIKSSSNFSINQNSSDDEDYTYLFGKIDINQFESHKDSVNNLILKRETLIGKSSNKTINNNSNNSNNSNNNNNNFNQQLQNALKKIKVPYLYGCNKDIGFIRMNLKTNQIEILNDDMSDFDLTSKCYQDNSVDDQLHFIVLRYYILIFQENQSRFVKLPNRITENVGIINSIYDGKDHLLIFSCSGFKTEIYKFHIRTHQFSEKPLSHNMPPIRIISLSRDTNNVYIICRDLNDTNSIYKIDTEVYSVEMIVDKNLKIKTAISGCYVPKKNAFYIFSGYYLYQYNVIVKYVNSTAKINGLPSQYYKVMYNGDDTIYLYSIATNELYEFDIVSCKLKKLADIFQAGSTSNYLSIV